MLLLTYLLLLLTFTFTNIEGQITLPPEIINAINSTLQTLANIIQKMDGLNDVTKIKMIDSSTKVPSGILAGNFFDLGNFDECYSIEANKIFGKYCVSTVDISLLGSIIPQKKKLTAEIHPRPRIESIDETYIGFHFAYCMPHTVSAEEISGEILTFNERLCSSKSNSKNITPGATVTITILTILILLLVASTAFDVFLFYSNRKSPHELLLAFSAFSNGRKLFQSSSNPEQLLCLNGIRAISMMWVILGHSYSLGANGPIINFADVVDWQNDATNMFINGAPLSVDSFFAVGGLVASFTFLKSMDKGVKFNIILYYVHRILRLTPALAIVVLVHCFLLDYLGNGPLWGIVDITLKDLCVSQGGWWQTLLYIANYISRSTCPPQTWYLQVDMQLFFLSPLLLIPLYRWRKLGLSLLGVASIAGVVVPFVIGFVYKINYFSSTLDDFEYYYVQTFARFGPYVIGLIAGYFIFKLKKFGRIPRRRPLTVVLLWLTTLGGLVACCYSGFNINKEQAPDHDRLGNAFLMGFNRNAWAISLCTMVYLCLTYGGPIDALLSLPVFQFLTKVSYSMYLVHYTVITMKYSSLRTLYYFSNAQIMRNYWGDFMLTLVLSVILCLVAESPVVILEKFLFRPKSDQKKQSEEKSKNVA